MAQVFQSRFRFPTLVGDCPGAAAGARSAFPFESWAAASGFRYPADALTFLRACGSAAEAFFVRPFVSRAGATFATSAVPTARAGGATLQIQVPAGPYRIDAVVERGAFRLAIEVDGLAFHVQSAEQVQGDYLRQRRLVALGYAVIRFTATEAFADPELCWKHIDAILDARARHSATQV